MPALVTRSRRKADGTLERESVSWPENGLPDGERKKMEAEGWTLEFHARPPETTREGKGVTENR